MPIPTIHNHGNRLISRSGNNGDRSEQRNRSYSDFQNGYTSASVSSQQRTSANAHTLAPIREDRRRQEVPWERKNGSSGADTKEWWDIREQNNQKTNEADERPIPYTARRQADAKMADKLRHERQREINSMRREMDAYARDNSRYSARVRHSISSELTPQEYASDWESDSDSGSKTNNNTAQTSPSQINRKARERRNELNRMGYTRTYDTFSKTLSSIRKGGDIVHTSAEAAWVEREVRGRQEQGERWKKTATYADYQNNRDQELRKKLDADAYQKYDKEEAEFYLRSNSSYGPRKK